MKEQSQIEDMRAAVRGDIERAERRRQDGSAIVPLVVPVPDAEPQPPPPAVEPEPERRSFGARFASVFRRS